MTLSERFGKMAQWSVDRRDVDYMKNMKITKESDSTGFKVGYASVVQLARTSSIMRVVMSSSPD